MAESVTLRRVRANGTSFSLREWGTPGRPPMLLVPGTGLSGALFAEAEQLLWRDWHGLTLDRRAHGLSDTPETGYDWTDFALDLAAIVRQLDLRDLTAVGHSAGGTDVLLATAKDSGRWRALGVIEPSVQDPRRAPDPETDPPSWHEVRDRYARRRTSFPSFDYAVERYLQNPGFASCRIERVREYLSHALMQHEDGTWAFRCPVWAELAMTIPIRAVMTHRYVPPEGRDDPFATLPGLSLPVHVYTTEHSGGFYPGMAKIAGEIVPGAESHDLPGLNHIVPLQSPETVADIAGTLRTAR